MDLLRAVLPASLAVAVATPGALAQDPVPVPDSVNAGGAPGDLAVPRRVATMSDLMVHVIYPASDAVFYIDTRTPTTDTEWGVLEGHTLLIAETANLLMMPERARDRGQWMQDAKLMLDVGEAAYRAARRRDVGALRDLNDSLYRSCVTCHMHYRPGYGRRGRGGNQASAEPDAGPTDPFGAAGGATLRVAAYNIKHGRGMDDVVDLERVAEVPRALDADVITLQEVDSETERTGGVDQTAVLADLIGYEGHFGPHRSYQGGEYGNAVLTRLPVIASRTHVIPPASGSALAVHELELEVEGVGPVSVVSVHLAGTREERFAQADAVTGLFAEADRPVVVAGDFNGRPEDTVVERLRRDWEIAPKSDDGLTYPANAPDREIDFVGFCCASHHPTPEREVQAEQPRTTNAYRDRQSLTQQHKEAVLHPSCCADPHPDGLAHQNTNGSPSANNPLTIITETKPIERKG